jgi:2-oxoglutarate ferredoxin oxidoreductase subunit delta
MPKITVNNERCKGCELCVISCPKKIIEMSAELNKKGYHFAKLSDESLCTGCGFCYQICPDVAIEVYK